MNKKRRVGLYLGVGSIGGVVVEGRKVISSSSFVFSSSGKEEETETLNGEIRWEILINKILREMDAQEKEIYVSLADKDFFFRSFKMPLM